MSSKKKKSSSKSKSKSKSRESAVSVSESMNLFAIDLYKALTRGGGSAENIFLSPASIAIALDLVYLGAQNDTGNQMAESMHIDQMAPGAYHKAMAAFLQGFLAEKDDCELRVANRLYAQQGFKILKKYLSASRKYYDADLQSVDFRKPAARETINSWVEEQTNDKIQDLIKPGVLNAATRLVLVNAIYFKGDWMDQFDKLNTQDENFNIDFFTTMKVAMMFREAEYRYGHSPELQAKALELPYKCDDLSMFVLLPDAVDGLAQLEFYLTGEQLTNLEKIFTMRKTKTQVWLPKFKLESEFQLSKVLTKLGIKDVFNPQLADLSGIDGSRSLFLSEVIHKAYVNVDEEGSEAAAATAGIIRLTALPPPMVISEFKADHPFLFMIRENSSGAILFLGRMAMPPEPDTTTGSTAQAQIPTQGVLAPPVVPPVGYPGTNPVIVVGRENINTGGNVETPSVGIAPQPPTPQPPRQVVPMTPQVTNAHISGARNNVTVIKITCSSDPCSPMIMK